MKLRIEKSVSIGETNTTYSADLEVDEKSTSVIAHIGRYNDKILDTDGTMQDVLAQVDAEISYSFPLLEQLCNVVYGATGSIEVAEK